MTITNNIVQAVSVDYDFGITNLNQYFKNIYNINQENADLELD